MHNIIQSRATGQTKSNLHLNNTHLQLANQPKGIIIFPVKLSSQAELFLLGVHIEEFLHARVSDVFLGTNELMQKLVVFYSWV